jgi:hypothetical protein
VPAAALILGLIFMDEQMTWARALAVTLVGASVTCALFGPALAREARLRIESVMRQSGVLEKAPVLDRLNQDR